MKIASILCTTAVLLGCSGQSSSTSTPNTETAVVAEAPVGMLKNLVKRLESSSPSDRRKAADEIAKLGPRARPMQQRLQEAIAKEPDAAVKTALATALEKTGG